MKFDCMGYAIAKAKCAVPFSPLVVLQSDRPPPPKKNPLLVTILCENQKAYTFFLIDLNYYTFMDVVFTTISIFKKYFELHWLWNPPLKDSKQSLAQPPIFV